MTPLADYLQDLLEIRRTGNAVKETSYYTPFANLMNAVGKTLKPKVNCVINIQNRGAGLPDGGFFTADQLWKPNETSQAEPRTGQAPARGVIEIKGTGENVAAIVASEQVAKYFKKYGQVLVTNYRDFVLVGKDETGNAVTLETYKLAANENEFWTLAANPHKHGDFHNDRFTDFLKRVMLHAAPLTSPQDVAWFLASYARDANARLQQSDLPALDNIRKALEESLGMTFEGKKGDHFFRSTLVQTLFYGVFSAWVLWCKQPTSAKAKFDWRIAAWQLRVPMIKVLFEQVAAPSKLGALGLVEILDWTAAALNRISRDEFFKKFEDAHAVQYFYEPFLEEFDPDLRKELGVWYTPPEIVKYMVARTDAALRTELGIADGLADKRVYVLDPCCGTGAYLVEVLNKIHETLSAKGSDGLTSDDLKDAAKERIFGFEILPAPFVVAHLQLGLLLQTLGSPFSDDKNERAAIFLTNALTGWQPPKEPKTHLLFPEFEAERDAAEKIKQEKPILVILGNPPYNAFAGVSPKEESGLVEPYKDGLIKTWGIKKFNLDDLYIRFFRLAEKRIAEATGKGIVCFISNFSYLRDPSFVVMRERFLKEFDSLTFDSLNGDSRETGKLTPEGLPDPSVFSTEQNKEGIRVGTAISLLVRNATRKPAPVVKTREFWGKTKRADLLTTLTENDIEAAYQLATPKPENKYSFRPSAVSKAYQSWPKLTDLCSTQPSNGLMEKRGGALIDIDKDALEKRMRLYYDKTKKWEQIELLKTGLTENAARYDAKKARDKVLASETFDEKNLQRYSVRPFETRWCYYSSIRPLWNECRPTLIEQRWDGNTFLVSRPAGVANPEVLPIYFTSVLGDNDSLRGHAYYFPIQLRQAGSKKKKPAGQENVFGDVAAEIKTTANLSVEARAYLKTLGITNADADKERAGLVWLHALAVGYSPRYLTENADGVRSDFPRIPLPKKLAALEQSASLGKRVAALLDTTNQERLVTSQTSDADLKTIGVLSKTNNEKINIEAGDLALRAGWGHGGNGKITMPSKGKSIERPYTAEEKKELETLAKAQGLSTKRVLELLGETTLDIYLNDKVYWKCVPANVWAYTIGGYQVVKKWLSYREESILKRALTKDEVREVTGTLRRLGALLLMQPALDANYKQAAADAYKWKGKA
jgi:hypothetical protein